MISSLVASSTLHATKPYNLYRKRENIKIVRHSLVLCFSFYLIYIGNAYIRKQDIDANYLTNRFEQKMLCFDGKRENY